MHGFIYFIRNTVTGHGYVGQTTKSRPELRWSEHKTVLRKGQAHNPRFQRSFSAHGEACFCFEVLERIEAPSVEQLRQELTAREDAWMHQLRAKGVTLYNAVSAGESVAGKPNMVRKSTSWNKGVPMSSESKQRVSDSKRGQPSAKKGVPMSEDQRQKVVASLQGNTRRKGTATSAQGRANISASKKGKPSPKRGVPISDVQKEALRQSHLGTTHTEATRAKMRASAAGRTWSLVDGKRVYSKPTNEEARA